MSTFRPTFARTRAGASHSGLTLVEVIISSGLLLLLIGLVLSLYLNSHRAWVKGAQAQEVLSDVQVALAYLTNDLQAAPFASLTLSADGKAMSFLSMKDEQGHIQYAPDGVPLWDRWLLYYSKDSKLIRQQVEWTKTPAERLLPLPIQSFESQALSSYLDGSGKVLSPRLKSWHLVNPPGSKLVNYKIVIEAERNKTRTLEMEGTIRPRN